MNRFIYISNFRILFFFSIFFTAKLIWISSESEAPMEMEAPAEGAAVERKETEGPGEPVPGSVHT